MKKALIFFAFLALASVITAGIIMFDQSTKIDCTDHKDLTGDGLCDVCDTETVFTCINHTDKNHDGLCDTKTCRTNVEISHSDSDGDGFCDATDCKLSLTDKPESPKEPDTETEEDDSEEEIPKEEIPEEEIPEEESCETCIDTNSDSECDICGNPIEFSPAPPCEICIDLDGDGFCNRCEKEIEYTPVPPCETCTDSDGNGACDICAKEIMPEIPDYPISSVSISGLSIENHVIAYDSSESVNEVIANEIKSLLYERAGILLSVKDIKLLTDEKYIAVKSQPKSGEEGFYVKTDSAGNLEIISEFPNKTQSAAGDYLNFLHHATGDVSFSEFVANVRDVFYSDFGAIGDGITDDYAKIKATHDYANEYGHTVVAPSNATYYLSSVPETIEILTNVCWENAIFIIDDTEITPSSPEKDISIFTVKSDYEPVLFEEQSPEVSAINSSGGIGKDTESINLNLGYPALLILENEECESFIFYGCSEGVPQKEAVLVDEFGNLDSSTPLTLNFEKLTSIYAFRADDTPITVSGGHFITRLNQSAQTESYSRNLMVCRSNTTLKRMRYETEGEAENNSDTSPYLAFFRILNSGNVIFEDCSVAARKLRQSSDGTELKNEVISIELSANIIFRRCNQTNFYGLSGTSAAVGNSDIMGISYSKNLIYERCTLSTLCAEYGVYNLTVKDSSIVKIEIVGSGDLLLENTSVYSDTVISLCKKSGSFWNGSIAIRNLNVKNKGAVNLIDGAWYNHDFGYLTSFPKEITVEGITLKKSDKIHLFSSELLTQTKLAVMEEWEAPVLDENGNETGQNEAVYNINPTSSTDKVSIDAASDYEIIIPDSEEFSFFADTDFVILE